MLYPFDKKVDEIVNKLLDEYEIKEPPYLDLTVKLGNAILWVGNRPYASGTIHNSQIDKKRPSRLTIKRLLDRLEDFEKRKEKESIEEIERKFFSNH